MIKRALYPVQVFFQELRHLQLFTLYYEQHDSQNTSHLIWAQLPTSMPPGVGGTCWLLGGVLQSSFQQATISSVLPLNAPARENLQRLTFLGSSHNPSATKTSLLLQPKRKQRRVLFRAQSMSSVVKEAKWGRVREAEGNKLYCRQWRFPKAHSISFLKKRRKLVKIDFKTVGVGEEGALCGHGTAFIHRQYLQGPCGPSPSQTLETCLTGLETDSWSLSCHVCHLPFELRRVTRRRPCLYSIYSAEVGIH